MDSRNGSGWPEYCSILGLLVEGICLLWARPLAFILLVWAAACYVRCRDCCVSLFAGFAGEAEPGRDKTLR